jgi:hypothetical protein
MELNQMARFVRCGVSVDERVSGNRVRRGVVLSWQHADKGKPKAASGESWLDLFLFVMQISRVLLGNDGAI